MKPRSTKIDSTSITKISDLTEERKERDENQEERGLPTTEVTGMRPYVINQAKHQRDQKLENLRETAQERHVTMRRNADLQELFPEEELEED